VSAVGVKLWCVWCVWGEKKDEGLRGIRRGLGELIHKRGLGSTKLIVETGSCGGMTRLAVMCSRGVRDRDGVLGGRGFVRGSEIVGDHPRSRQVHHELLRVGWSLL
jgi:hypothetical protein